MYIYIEIMLAFVIHVGFEDVDIAEKWVFLSYIMILVTVGFDKSINRAYRLFL